MRIIKKKPLRGTTIRVWLSTRAKLKAISKYYRVPMTRILDQICDKIIEANGLSLEEGEQNNEGN